MGLYQHRQPSGGWNLVRPLHFTLRLFQISHLHTMGSAAVTCYVTNTGCSEGGFLMLSLSVGVLHGMGWRVLHAAGGFTAYWGAWAPASCPLCMSVCWSATDLHDNYSDRQCGGGLSSSAAVMGFKEWQPVQGGREFFSGSANICNRRDLSHTRSLPRSNAFQSMNLFVLKSHTND